MRLLFSILSISYIAGIFLFADSSVVSTLSTFNPYSLLHIPLYGILTVLLIFSFVPITQLPNNLFNQINLPRGMQPALWSVLNYSMGSLFHRGQADQINQRNLYLLPAFIALIVAVADEIHQVYVPGRDASITDVLLDLFGIILVLFFAFYLFKKKNFLKTQLTQ